MDKLLSVVIPSYNEEEMVSVAAETILRILDGAAIPCELLFVDDGSSDQTWKRIEAVCAKEPRVRGLRFSRNFGKESALLAGLKYAAGDCCVTIDCDLQHPPEKIVDMYRLWEQGYEIVEGVKVNRGYESAFHRFASDMFYRIMTRAVGREMKNRSDFKLLGRRAVDALLSMPEREMFYRAQSAWMGFRATTLDFEVSPRVAGESKWNTRKLAAYAIRNITNFTAYPLRVILGAGVLMLLVALGLCIYALAAEATLFVQLTAVILLVGGIIMTSLGIMGYYLSRMFNELRARPRYIVSEYAGGDDEEAAR